jgi:hypothetical protein
VPSNPRTPTFLNWVADRFVFRHSESPNVDFVMRLRHEAARAQTLLTNLSVNHCTYMLIRTDDPSTAGPPPRHVYVLQDRSTMQVVNTKLRLTDQQAEDIARQLDASVDYFND